jgi:hypothetical protein
VVEALDTAFVKVDAAFGGDTRVNVPSREPHNLYRLVGAAVEIEIGLGPS